MLESSLALIYFKLSKNNTINILNQVSTVFFNILQILAYLRMRLRYQGWFALQLNDCKLQLRRCSFPHFLKK